MGKLEEIVLFMKKTKTKKTKQNYYKRILIQAQC